MLNDTINKLEHGAIAVGTGITLTAQDHTTQIIALVIQIISLIGLLLGRSKSK